MMQWEYRKIDLNNTPRMTDDVDMLIDAGKDRWELVGITTNNIAYLKRPLEDAAAPAATVRRKAATPRTAKA